MRALLRSVPLVLSLTLLVPQAATARSTTAQTIAIQTKTALSKPASRYADESVLLDRDDWIYSINPDGTGYSEYTVAATAQSDAAVRQLGVISVDFASASEHVVIVYARVRHKDGSVTQTPVSGAMEQPDAVTQQAPFYSDLKKEELPIKDLQVGDTLEWQARIVRTKPQAPNQFWGSQTFLAETDGVALEESIELRIPAASAATVWTNPRLNVKPTETIDGATKVYVWKSAQLKPTAGPEADAAKKAKKGELLTPDEELDVEQGVLPSVAWTSFKSWADVGAWYRGLEGTRAVPNDDIKAKVASLTAGKTTEEDKVRAVYGYVSSQIRYIGVAFGIGRFQPHEADDVLQNQYGDCKDKATLLASMLEVLGLHPDSVLIGSGVRMNEAVPSPGSFNHLINRVQVDGEEVWLDSTTEIAPYQVLVFPLRDKLALVVPEQGTATLERTPKSLPFPSLYTWKAAGTLNQDGVSESHITLSLRGDVALIFRAAAHEVAPGQYNDLMQRAVGGMGYSGTVSNASLTRPDDTSQPFVMSFDYHREKAGDWPNLRTFAQMMPVGLPIVDDSNPPSATIILGVPHTEISDAAMKLPEGWTAELPDAQHDDSKWATYDLTYRFDKGTLYTESKLVILQRKVPASDWKAYKKWCDDVGVGQNPYIQLHRADGSTVADLSKISKNDPNAPTKVTAALFEKLDQIMQHMNAENAAATAQQAESLLKQIEATDPNAVGLWKAYAALAELRGEPMEAITDSYKELALHPRDTNAYGVLAGAQAEHNDVAGAITTLKRWAAADPTNPRPEAALARMLMLQKKYSEAAAAGTKWQDLEDPQQAAKNEPLQLLLGHAQLSSGLATKGEATLLTLLKSTNDVGIMNDAAYSLADAKLDLPLDEQKVQIALNRITTKTQSWTLDEAPTLLQTKTSQLEATWDTMGWILFREGKFPEAKSYLQAASIGQNNKEKQAHLNAVNQALGVTDKNSQLSPRARSQKERTFDLGHSHGINMVAEYKLLLSQGRVERAKPSGEKSVPGAEEMLKRVDFSRYFPAGSNAKLFKLGFVSCSGKSCELVLE